MHQFIARSKACILMTMEMNKANVPRSFGIFKPVGHTVICVRSAALLAAAEQAFREKGFAQSSLIQYTPQEMIDQVEADFLSASPLAEFGQELNLARTHQELAKSGCSFLVVYSPDSESEAIVDSLIESIKPVMAQRYGRLIVEELVSAKGDPHQLPESLDTGLDTKSSKSV
jgi:hypothetical protein